MSKSSRFVSLFISIVFVFTSLLLLTSGKAFAAGGYDTNKFNVDVHVNRDNSYDITETIEVNFIEPRHGIYRYVPEKANRVEVVDVTDEDGNYYTVEEEHSDGNFVMKIGDEDITVSGQRTYIIKYRLICYDDKDATMDKFSLNLLPLDWESAIASARVNVTFPGITNLENLLVYSGPLGSKANTDKIVITKATNGEAFSFNVQKLKQGHGVTVSTALPEGYWEGEASMDWIVWLAIILAAAVLIFAFAAWVIFGRDAKAEVTVEFYPPRNLSPGEIGYLIDGIVDNEDILALIPYLANKGYMSIHQFEDKSYLFKKEKEISSKEPLYVRNFYSALFATGDEVRPDDLDEYFGQDFENVKLDLKDEFKHHDVYSLPSKICQFVFQVAIGLPIAAFVVAYFFLHFETFLAPFAIVPAVIAIVGSIIIGNTFNKKYNHTLGHNVAMLVIGIVALLAALIPALLGISSMENYGPFSTLALRIILTVSTLGTSFFACFMLARNEESARTLAEILGFKHFIKTAELEKLQALVDEDPEYFYGIIPYAYIFGLEDKWIKNFKKIPMEAPRWFYGCDPWDMYFIGRMFDDYGRDINNAVASYASSELSGAASGGGGFSGGGFGGGGGGSW
ncbi:MAG: DUF2207 domain-containing protein [Clostridia bacterium]|nr:DUF2207 domain-containing protein [Clostridia bacterium]